MMSEQDRRRLETIIDRDPFAAMMSKFVQTLRTDDLAATLFLHERIGGNCRCEQVQIGKHHVLHLADKVRAALDTQSR